MKRFVLALCVLVACTPPSVYREEKAPPAREGVANEAGPRGSLRGGMGPAGGADGIALWSTPNEMYGAFAELAGGSVAQGAETYEVEVSPNPTTDEQARAVELLRARAERSAEHTARGEGSTLLRVQFISEPPDENGAFTLHVVSELQEKDGHRRREVRDALVVPRKGEVPDFTWTGPPRAQ
jgi:hypothetical protein